MEMTPIEKVLKRQCSVLDYIIIHDTEEKGKEGCFCWMMKVETYSSHRTAGETHLLILDQSEPGSETRVGLYLLRYKTVSAWMKQRH